MTLEQLRQHLQRQAKIARGAERALTLLEKGITNRRKIGRVINSAIEAGKKTFEEEILGDDEI